MLDVPLTDVRNAAIAAEARGRSGAWVIEAKHDPFVALSSCADAGHDMTLGMAVAVAFVSALLGGGTGIAGWAKLIASVAAGGAV